MLYVRKGGSQATGLDILIKGDVSNKLTSSLLGCIQDCYANKCHSHLILPNYLFSVTHIEFAIHIKKFNIRNGIGFAYQLFHGNKLFFGELTVPTLIKISSISFLAP